MIAASFASARDVEQPLFGGDQQRDQQCGAAVVEVDRPGDLSAVGERSHRSDQFQQQRLVVGDALREQSVAVGIDDHAMVVGFSGVDAGPQLLPHNHLRDHCYPNQPSRRPRRRVLTQRSNRISQLAVESSRDAGRPISFGHTQQQTHESHTRRPWVIRSLRPTALITLQER
jgi:hypothetical protein